MQEYADFLKSLDAKGEEEVRRTLARNGWNEGRAGWAQSWLASLDNTREERRNSDNLRIASSAKTAAWVAAIAAIVANVIAVAAVVISYFAWASPR